MDRPELDSGHVMIPIGADMAHLLFHLKIRQGRRDEPIAVKGPLGWTLFGNVNQGHCETVSANFLGSDKEITLQHQIKQFLGIDSFATKQAILESSTLKEEDHYKTALL